MSDLNTPLGLGPLGLDFLTLEDAAARLSSVLAERINPQTLLDYGVQNTSDLVFSIYCNNWFLFRKVRNASGKIDTTRDLLDGLVDLELWTVKELRTKENIEVTRVKACCDALLCAVSTHHWGHTTEEWKDFLDNTKPGTGEPTFPRISRSDLRIRRSELERLLVLVAPLVREDSVPQSSVGNLSGSFEQFTKSAAVDEIADPASNFDATQFESDASVRPSKDTDNPTQSITDELAKEKAAQKSSRSEIWRSRAREIANTLDSKHKIPKLNNLAGDIQEELKKEGLMNRNNKLPSVETIKREILRGWKSGK
jgi:hypothetical protein